MGAKKFSCLIELLALTLFKKHVNLNQGNENDEGQYSEVSMWASGLWKKPGAFGTGQV